VGAGVGADVGAGVGPGVRARVGVNVATDAGPGEDPPAQAAATKAARAKTSSTRDIPFFSLSHSHPVEALGPLGGDLPLRQGDPGRTGAVSRVIHQLGVVSAVRVRDPNGLAGAAGARQNSD
jgi:hypothetical protein